MKKQWMKSAALMLAGMAVAACSHDDDSAILSESDAYMNAQQVLSVTIDPNQDWNMTTPASVAVTADAGIDADEVLVLDGYPFGNANAKVLARADVSEGSTVTLDYTAPKGATTLYVACRNARGDYRVRGIDAATTDVSFTSSQPSAAPTRAEVATPSVATTGEYTFNAKLAREWASVNAALATGTDYNGYFASVMNSFASWNNSGWDDQYFQVTGSVTSSGYTEQQAQDIYNTVTSVIPEGQDNYSKAVQTGYTITTKGGEVKLTPIHASSNSNDQISYYYYPAGQKPTAAQIKTMPKYTLGKMGGDLRKTYKLVYVDAQGRASYNFPADYVICFLVTNTSQQGTYKPYYAGGGITTSTGGSSAQWEPVDYWLAAKDYQVNTGEYVRSANGQAQMQFSNAWVNDTPYTFNKKKTLDTNFTIYTEGNGVNGSISNDGSTQYNIYPYFDGLVRVGVVLSANRDFYIYDNGTPMQGYPITKTEKYYGTFDFYVVANHRYTVLATGTKLGFYGYYCYKLTGGSQPTVSTSDVTWDYSTLAFTPEYYADGELNYNVHTGSTGMWELSAATNNPVPKQQNITGASHNAVFSFNGKNYLGFEDWVDFDYNDLVFEVEGTTGGEEITVEKVENQIYSYAFEDTKGGDYDMNDVVLKAQENERGDSINLTLVASGATLSLNVRLYDYDANNASGNYYGTNFQKLTYNGHDEVHDMLGVDRGTMVNTNWGAKARPVTIRLPKGSHDASRLRLAIYSAEQGEMRLAGSGQAPYGVIIPYDWQWPTETVCINQAYNNRNTSESEADQSFTNFAANAGHAELWYKYPSRNVMDERSLGF